MIERLPEDFPEGSSTEARATLERFARVVNQISAELGNKADRSEGSVTLPLHQGTELPADGGPNEVRLWWNPVTSQVTFIAHVAGGWRRVGLE